MGTSELIPKTAVEVALDFIQSRDKACQDDRTCAECAAFSKCYANYLRKYLVQNPLKAEDVQPAIFGALFKRLT